jgi:hypothetical protein
MNRNDVQNDTTYVQMAPIEFDNTFQTQLETQFYGTVRRDHCEDPERCSECSDPSYFQIIREAYSRLINDYTGESTSNSVKIQIILFIISFMNRYAYFFKPFPMFISVINDRIIEIESKKTRIMDTWYIDYIDDRINEFYDIYKDRLMNR